MTKIDHVYFGNIFDVKKSGDEDGTYFAKVEMSFGENEPLVAEYFCAKANDPVNTGIWVYQQIVAGNFQGELVQLAQGEDPYPSVAAADQPTADGVDTL